MEEFTLKGNGSYLKIELVEVYGFPESTSHSGGYDTKSIVEIYSDGFKVSSIVWISTGEIFEFYRSLKQTNQLLIGTAYLYHLEGNLECNATYGNDGHISIRGIFSKQNMLDNQLKFHFESDQSYIQSTLIELEIITNKYGGMKGIK
ncbi:WapI family immunity protein [Mucilaginibacter sp.]